MKQKPAPSLGFQITLAARLYRTQLGRLLSEIGLFAGQEQVLKALGEAPDGLSMGDLARILHVQPPTLTKSVQRLQSQALILRLAKANDGRVVHLMLTPAGQEKLTLVREAEDALEASLSAAFKPKAEKRLRKGLKRVAKQLAPQAPDSPPPDAPPTDIAPDED